MEIFLQEDLMKNKSEGKEGRYVARLIMLRVWGELGVWGLPTPPRD